MSKKMYIKEGFVFINTSKEYSIGDIQKYHFFMNDISKNKGNLSKDILKKYYETKGFIYQHYN